MHWHGYRQGMGSEARLTFLLSLSFSRRYSSLQSGPKGASAPCAARWQAGPVGAGSGFPQQQGHLLAAPQSLHSGRADKRLGHAGHTGSNLDGVCVIISQGDFRGSPWLLSSGHEHPLLQKPRLVNVL